MTLHGREYPSYYPDPSCDRDNTNHDNLEIWGKWVHCGLWHHVFITGRQEKWDALVPPSLFFCIRNHNEVKTGSKSQDEMFPHTSNENAVKVLTNPSPSPPCCCCTDWLRNSFWFQLKPHGEGQSTGRTAPLPSLTKTPIVKDEDFFFFPWQETKRRRFPSNRVNSSHRFERPDLPHFSFLPRGFTLRSPANYLSRAAVWRSHSIRTFTWFLTDQQVQRQRQSGGTSGHWHK